MTTLVRAGRGWRAEAQAELSLPSSNDAEAAAAPAAAVDVVAAAAPAAAAGVAAAAAPADVPADAGGAGHCLGPTGTCSSRTECGTCLQEECTTRRMADRR